ncbi:carbohydrate kinase [Fistulina hepatica ATCC 64428]|uniref:Gluconokinase n=1 Tax=Fistulina hepatica ATCC 64428 TaxID=1128425 RepID=A0A0D7AGH7_9AGAR|nr:carbohydrate kinase [Fistulina hepatica ATCC 64428]
MAEHKSSHPASQGPMFVIAMGVSGTGKSTLGAAVAKALGLPFIDGDDLHPPKNIDKMSHGIPLNDDDRRPWLGAIRQSAQRTIAEQESADRAYKTRHGVVIACSALKKAYRDILRGLPPVPSTNGKTYNANGKRDNADTDDDNTWSASECPVYFVYIDGTREEIYRRMLARQNHFMKADMLDSQLNALEVPIGEPGVIPVPLIDSIEDQARKAIEGLTALWRNNN